MTNANRTIEALRAEDRRVLDELAALETVVRPGYAPVVAAEHRAAHGALMARHASLRGVLDEHARATAYTCPQDSSATFLANLPRLDSLCEEE